MQDPPTLVLPQSHKPDPACKLLRTPGLPVGPYYPVRQPPAPGAELWTGDGLPEGGRRLLLDGTVCLPDGAPAAGVLVELWHADPWGRYPHASDPGGQASMRGFTGYGRAVTDTAGAFSFRSLVPGAYEEQGRIRARHLHVQLTGRIDRVATQLFLPDDPGNRADRWFTALRHPELLVPRVLDDTPDLLHLAWPAVLTSG